MTKPLSSRDYETLSAYLDGELSERERAKLETRLSQQPELRAGLEEMRQTSLLLRSLPMTRAPRNFTISPEKAGVRSKARRAPRAYPFLRLASALAAVLFVIAFAGDLALGRAPSLASTQSTGVTQTIPAAAPTAAPMQRTFSRQTNPNPEPPAAPQAIQPGQSANDAANTTPDSQPSVAASAANPESSSAAGSTIEEPSPTSAPALSEPEPTATPTEAEAGITQFSVPANTQEATANGAGSAPAPTNTPEPTPVPTATPMHANDIVPPTVGSPNSVGISTTPDARTAQTAEAQSQAANSAASSKLAVTTAPEPFMSGGGPVATQPSQPLSYANPPGTNPVQEYVRPALHASEFFLAGVALLAGLAALILKLTSRP